MQAELRHRNAHFAIGLRRNQITDENLTLEISVR
jgi:hypothetical protein